MIAILKGNTPLERYFQDLSRGILKAPTFLKSQLVNQKNKYAVVYELQIRVVKRAAMGKRVWFFFTMFFTSVICHNNLELHSIYCERS